MKKYRLLVIAAVLEIKGQRREGAQQCHRNSAWCQMVGGRCVRCAHVSALRRVPERYTILSVNSN